MSNFRNMDEPVTRRELHEALDLWGGAIMSRMDAMFAAQTAHLTAHLDARMDARFAATEQRLSAELARHVQASEERLRVFIAALDEKYSDLPPRVAALEGKVVGPKRRKPAIKARRRR